MPFATEKNFLDLRRYPKGPGIESRDAELTPMEHFLSANPLTSPDFLEMETPVTWGMRLPISQIGKLRLSQ